MDALWLGPFGRPSLQRFGGEVACATLWMFTGLALQALVNCIGIGRWIPSALLFSVPFIVTRSWGLTHITLPVRIMEWKMGRFGLKRIPMYVVAHSFGYFVGLVLFYLAMDTMGTIPYISTLTRDISIEGALQISPGMGGALGGHAAHTAASTGGIHCDASGVCSKGAGDGGEALYSVLGVVADVIATSLYGLAMVVVPEVLLVNKKSVTATVPLITVTIVLVYSLVCVHVLDFQESSMLNPLAYGVLMYGKWLNTANLSSRSFQESIIVTIGGLEPFIDLRQSNLLVTTLLLGGLKYSITPRIIDHFAGNVIGGVVAGTLCNAWFPDDPATWKPWRDA